MTQGPDGRWSNIHPDNAQDYWQAVLQYEHGRYFSVENCMLARRPFYAAVYAMEVIKGPWPEFEKFLTRNTSGSRLYARYVLKGRFRLYESAICARAARNKTAARLELGRYLSAISEFEPDWHSSYAMK